MGFILGISASAVFLWLFIIVSKKKDNVKKYKTKAINSKDEEILTGYDEIEALQNIDKNKTK